MNNKPGIIAILVLLTGITISCDLKSDNPFENQYQSFQEYESLLIFGAATWNWTHNVHFYPEGRTYKGTYTYDGNYATMAVTHYYQNRNWVPHTDKWYAKIEDDKITVSYTHSFDDSGSNPFNGRTSSFNERTSILIFDYDTWTWNNHHHSYFEGGTYKGTYTHYSNIFSAAATYATMTITHYYLNGNWEPYTDIWDTWYAKIENGGLTINYTRSLDLPTASSNPFLNRTNTWNNYDSILVFKDVSWTWTNNTGFYNNGSKTTFKGTYSFTGFNAAMTVTHYFQDGEWKDFTDASKNKWNASINVITNNLTVQYTP
ncbi:MAG: hypothetical protein LBH43_05990 [Treponema sp.]|jgi:hypothetical protein|nr:hypothetical protein [Treponema sp.]